MQFVALGAFAGVVVFGLLFIILGLKGGPWKLPGIGMVVCFVLLIVSVVLFTRGNGDPEAEESQDVDASESVGAEESAEPGEEGGAPQDENSDLYKITYQSSKIYKNSLDEISCYALVEIENVGTVDLYLSSAVFDFEDADGSLLGTCSGTISSDPDIIAPGEKGYFYCNMGSVDGSIDEKADYVFKPSLKVSESKNDIIRYDISDLSISDGGTLSPVSIIGRITNNTEEDAGLIWIACVIYRSDGTPIGVYGTTVTDLAAGQTASFGAGAVYLSALDMEFSDVADYKVYACKAQYQ